MTTWSKANKAGLVLQLIFGVLNLPSAFFAADPGETGPPASVMWASTILSVVIIGAVIAAFRAHSHGAARLSSACNVLITALSLPAFFVDVPAPVKALVAVTVVWTLVSVALTHSPNRSTAAL